MRRLMLLGCVYLLVNVFLPNIVLAQTNTVTGSVLAEDGSPISGVTVSIRGTSRATSSADDGSFSIIAEKGNTIEFSHIGYVTQSTIVKSGPLNVILSKHLDRDLEEVVVTAMDQKRSARELGFSTQSIDGDEVKDAQRENFLNGMQGRIAGLTINPTSGTAGASTQIVLRGFNSLSLDNSPLFVVDGVILDNGTTNTADLTGTTENRREDFTNRISDLNPNDIATITALKGPEATALYGSQASSGAIIITTKKSVVKKGIEINYDNSFRISKLTRFPETIDYYGIGSNGVISETFTAFGPRYPDSVTLYNNRGNFFKTGFSQTHNLALAFGSKVSSFRVSGSTFNQDGFIPANKYSKYNLRISNNTNITKWLEVSPSISFASSKNQKVLRGASAYMLNLLTWPAFDDIRDYQTPDGLKNPIFNSNPNAEIDNPFFNVYRNPGEDKTNRLTGTLGINIKPFSWLTVNGRFGYDYYRTVGYQMYDSMSYFLTRAQKGSLRNNYINYYGYNHTITTTARKEFGKITTRLLLGTMWQDYETQTWSVSGNNLVSQSRRDSANTDPATRLYLFNQQFRNGEPNYSISRQVAYFGEAMVGWNNFIFLTYSHRFETSSIFPKQYRNYNYPAASMSVILSDIIPGIKTSGISFWKVRGSIANTARSASPYSNQSLFNANTGSGGGFYYGVTNANPFLQPERQNTYELGTELRMLKNRINLDFTYYNTTNENLIVQNFRASYGTGFILNTLNVGSSNNRGIEVALAINAIQQTDFNWNTRLNFNKMKNKILSLPNNVPEFYISDTWLYGNARGGGSVGLPTTTLTGYGYARNDAGQILIDPATGVPINDLTFGVRGDRNPDFTLGWVNTLRYKNWGLNILWDLKVGGDIYNATEKYLTTMGRSLRTADRETPRIVKGVLKDGLENTANPTENTIVVTPYYYNSFYGTAMPEEEFIQKDVNWFRLRDITLSYNFGNNLVQRLRVIKNLGAFVTVTDPLIFTNYLGADPQVNGNTSGSRGVGGFGIDYGNVGMPVSVNFGLRLGFK